ncbi:hypothetical protein ACIQWR_32370 [Streptomyces sp. NPDC098789]|uniref:hypothetical protein n=1 Tax=Streptomyces sp. NPDC098789 TaxID=3366098 RepID=UPI00380A9524
MSDSVEAPYGTPFGDLVRTAKAEQGLTLRQLEARSRDPHTGHHVGLSTFHKIVHDQSIMIDPLVLGAVARAIGHPDRAVRIAAAQQYCGLVTGDPFGASDEETTVVVAHVPGLKATDMPKVEQLLTRWAADAKSREAGQAG